jgi:hypothetical protein
MIPKFSFWEGSATLKANNEDMHTHTHNMMEYVIVTNTKYNGLLSSNSMCNWNNLPIPHILTPPYDGI